MADGPPGLVSGCGIFFFFLIFFLFSGSWFLNFLFSFTTVLNCWIQWEMGRNLDWIVGR